MNLFSNFFISALFYNLLFYSTVVCRISDKKKCADADCSEPISLATTLIRYNADDERLLSFPRNIKLRVFSKEAGDTPQFWEVEEGGSNKCMNYQDSSKTFFDMIYGKRGYVPKGLLREDKVLIPPNKLTHIVPTGRIDPPKQNITNTNVVVQEPNSVSLLSATPELPVANSKGLFSTIGGVSADSVPMNSPDIKPQSTRKFQVFEGTTIYEDVVNEKPESPPIVIDSTLNENHESEKKEPLDSKEVPEGSNVPSPDIKSVNPSINENEQPLEARQKSEKDINELTGKEKGLKNAESEGEENQHGEDTPESPSESGLFGNLYNKVTNYMSSGAGEEDISDEALEEEEGEEEGDEEGSAEEEDYENDIEPGKLEGSSARPTERESENETQPEGEQLETSHIKTSDNLINVVDKSSSDVKLDNVLKSEKHVLNEETIQDNVSAEKNTDVERDQKLAEESKKEEGETDLEEEKEIEVSQQNYPPSTSEEKEGTVAEFTEVGKDGYKLNLQSDLTMKQKFESPLQAEPQKSDAAKVFYQPRQQDKVEVESTLAGEIKAEGEFKEKESTSEPTEDQSTETSESHIKSDSDQINAQELKKTIEEPPKTSAELEIQEQPQTDKPEVQESNTEEPKVELYKTSDELQVQEQPETNEPKVKEQPKTADEPQILEQPQTDKAKVEEEHETVTDSPSTEPQVQEKLDSTTSLPSVEPPTRQLLFGYRQVNEVSPNELKYETAETTPHIETLNDTTNVDSTPPSDSTYSSFPSLPIGSPKYASVISRRIRSSESIPVNEIQPNSEEEEESEPQLDQINDTSESTATHEVTVSPELLLHSQSPKYSSVVNRQFGSHAPTDDGSGTASEEEPVVKAVFPESLDASNKEESDETPSVEISSQAEIKTMEETESEEVTVVESIEVPLQDSQILTQSDAVSPANVVDETVEEISTEGGMLSWITSFFNIFGSADSGITGINEEIIAKSENLDPSRVSHFQEETCSADGMEGSCNMFRDAIQKEVTWQESSYTSDMWDLMDRVPLEATIWLVITAVVVLIFSLGHYYIEAHRRDGPLVAIINKLEREVMILKKESCIMEDRLQIAQQQLEAWSTSSTENDALIIELKQELDEARAARAELEEQVSQLKEELDTVTESGLEMHRLLEESLCEDGSQVLLSTVETLREKLQRQDDEISGLSQTLSGKNAEIEELQGKLAQAAEVARSLEDKVISVTREKEEEALQLRDKHRELISQLEEVMETKALEETRLSTEMSKLRLTVEELLKTVAEKDSELETLKEVVKQLRSTDSNEKIDALFDVVGVQAKLKTAIAERDDFREKFLEEEGARKLLEGHMKKITQEVAELKNSFETAEKEKIEALTKLQVLSNYFKEKESQLQKELGLQESMWLQKQSDDHTIYEQMRSLREENEKYKLQNESLKKEIVEQESSFKIQLANTEQKAHENWVASRQAERKLKEAQQESAQLRNRLTLVEKNSANYSLDEKQNISESNGDPSSPPPSLMFPPTTSPPFMMYGPPMPGDFVPPPPFMGSPYPSDSRPPPLGRISSPQLDPHRFSPPPPLPYPPYDYPQYGHHSPSPPPPMHQHHRNVHKPQPREMSREQKDHVPNYSPEAEKTTRRNKR